MRKFYAFAQICKVMDFSQRKVLSEALDVGVENSQWRKPMSQPSVERFKKNCSRAREGVEGETQLKGGGHRLTTAATTFF